MDSRLPARHSSIRLIGIQKYSHEDGSPGEATTDRKVDGATSCRVSTLTTAGKAIETDALEIAGVAGGPAPVDRQDMVVHVAVFWIGQKHRADGNLVDRPGAAE